MDIFNCCNPKKSKFCKNFFFIGTLLIVVINLFVFYANVNLQYYGVVSDWNDVLNFQNLYHNFLSAFVHKTQQHMLLNSLCFLIAGGYVERKYGSISLLSLVFVFAFFAENIVYANHGGVSVGFSGVNYSFYAYIIVDFIFTIKEIKNSKVETIISVIVLALIYVAFCFCGGTQSLAFKIYPYDLITNMGHYSSFLTGLTLSLLIKISKVKALSEKD